MPLYLIWIIIFALYLRTIGYCYVIDDYVRREGYLWDVPMKGIDPKTFFHKKPSWNYRLFMIAMHAINTSVIYLLWGWAPALLFAVHPMATHCTAWVTGNYYATTCYFTLIAYYIMHTFPTWWGSLIAMPIYLSALNSTVCAMTFPFLAAFMPWGWAMFIPLILFMNGKRFKTGLQTRVRIVKGSTFDSTKFTPKRLFFMVKVVARYLYIALVPMKVYFFGQWAEKIRNQKDVWDKFHSADAEFWASLTLCAVFFAAGIWISPIGTMWFFIIIAIHSQFNLLGQTFAQRYLYLALPGVCVVVGTLVQPYPVVVMFIAGWLAHKTHTAIPNWKSQDDLLKNEMLMNPTRGESFSGYWQFLMGMKRISERPRYEVNYLSYLIRKAVVLDPDDWKCRMNLTAYLMSIGDLDTAEVESMETLRLIKRSCSDWESSLVKNAEKQVVEIRRMKKFALKAAGYPAHTIKQIMGRD